jgi:hypothetical protein
MHQIYNSSESETYVADGALLKIYYAGMYAEGFRSKDTVRFAGLEVKDQVFEEATSLKPSPFYYGHKMDSVLGLSRLSIASPESKLESASPPQNIFGRNILSKNLFSLELSKTTPRIDGEIMFGDINPELLEGELMSVPITSTSANGKQPLEVILDTGWQVAAHSLSFDTGPKAIHADLSGYTAAFLTNFPWISLPEPLALRLQDRCGGDDDWMGNVNCAKRDELPDVKIRLRPNGEASLVISARDYLIEVPAIDGGTTCLVPWYQHEEPDDEPKHILLGSAFLTGVYTVFDADSKTISCKLHLCQLGHSFQAWFHAKIWL